MANALGSRREEHLAGTHVALIRGINVGHAKRVAMADLRAIVSELGYGNPRTLLNSGNVLFDAPEKDDCAAKIEAALLARLGVSARVLTLTAAELAEAVASNPLVERSDDPTRLLVAALRRPFDRKALTALAKERWEPEAFALGRHVAYLWCAQGILHSRLLPAFGRLLSDGTTTRNWATILKLHAMLGA